MRSLCSLMMSSGNTFLCHVFLVHSCSLSSETSQYPQVRDGNVKCISRNYSIVRLCSDKTETAVPEVHFPTFMYFVLVL